MTRSGAPQFRRVRMTPPARFLLSYLKLGQVVEIDADGKDLWRYENPDAMGRDPAIQRQHAHRRRARTHCARSEPGQESRLGIHPG